VAKINGLRQAINRGNVIQLKRLTRDIIARLASSKDNQQKDRIEKRYTILHDIATLRDFYKGSPLKTRMGSDSTGRNPRVHGMGLVILNTLPRRTQNAVGHTESPLPLGF